MGSFRDNLRVRRLQLLMSQDELAKKIGVTQTAIWLYENGEATPKLEIALRLAKVLGMTVEQLAGEESPKASQ
jgi:putative transcriptional regulator